MAAGITVKPGSAHAFAQALDAAVGRELESVSRREPRHYDMEVSIAQCTPDLLRRLRKFEPFGPGSPAPVFLARDVRLTQSPRQVGREGRHLRLSMDAGKGALSIPWARDGPPARRLGRRGLRGCRLSGGD